MDDDVRPLGHGLEIPVGYDGRNLDDLIPQRVQPGHFQVDPYQS